MAEKDDKIEKLVALAKKGDADAFGAIYDELSGSLYRYIYFRVDKKDVEDLLEVTFLKAWKNIHQYKERKTSFSAWIFKIAHNLVIDHYRLKKNVSELKITMPTYQREHNPVRVAEDKLTEKALKEALKGLPNNYQQIIMLKFINELSNKEISEILKKSEGSLRILQFRALKSLKEILSDMGVNY